MFATSLVLINSTFISRWKGFLQLAHRNNDCFQTPQDVIGDLGPHGMCCVLFVTEDNTHTSTPITYAGVKPYKEHSRPEGDANHSDDNPHGTRFMTGDYPAWSFKMTQNTQDEALQVTAVLKSNHLSTGSGVRDQKVKTTHACPKKSPLGSRIPGSQCQAYRCRCLGCSTIIQPHYWKEGNSSVKRGPVNSLCGYFCRFCYKKVMLPSQVPRTSSSKTRTRRTTPTAPHLCQSSVYTTFTHSTSQNSFPRLFLPLWPLLLSLSLPMVQVTVHQGPLAVYVYSQLQPYIHNHKAISNLIFKDLLRRQMCHCGKHVVSTVPISYPLFHRNANKFYFSDCREGTSVRDPAIYLQQCLDVLLKKRRYGQSQTTVLEPKGCTLCWRR